MAQPVPSFLGNDDLKLLLFGGKGGVGKTTAAAASACHRAAQHPERRVLLVSTDPAHSLSDSFDQPIGDEVRPIAGVPNLFALEMDAGRRLEAFKQQYGDVLKTIAERGTYFDQEDIASFFDLALPGMDELMSVIEVSNIVRDGQYDLVILDTAPTGHTLRLLALPHVMKDWMRVLNLMLAKQRYMASVFGRYHPDKTDAFLAHMSSDLERLRALLSDAHTTEFVPVTIPEAMSLAETARLLDGLTELHLPVRSLVVNRVMAQRECPFCMARRRDQTPYLAEIERCFPTLQRVLVPLVPQEVRGLAALRDYAQMLLGQDLGEASVPPLVRAAVRPAGTRDAVTARRLGAPAAQLLLFGGKGGVGKTTLAAATAIHLARENSAQRTLLFSTDPAHSLSDSLGQEIGNQITPVAGVPGLFALEMEASQLLEELRRDYVAEMDELFEAFLGNFDAPFDRQVMQELISLTPPGLDELMALTKIMDYIAEGAFDRYVLDLAPTGHALRFLEMPALVRKWFIAFIRLILKYQGVVTLTRVGAMLRDRSKQLREVERLLTDAGRCEFFAVTIPEAMAVLETERLLQRLSALSITCRWVVVNMLMPATDCAFCAARRQGQLPHLQELDALTPGLIQVPLCPHEIRGIAGLTEMAQALYGGGDAG
jgi:arsenite-transporting ATPase